MVWVRGNRQDYHGWKDFGLEGWSHADCTPYFKKLETYHGALSPERGHDGPMSIVESQGDHVFYDRFLWGGEACGLPQAKDYNGGPQEGTHLTQVNIKNGVRCSAAEAYLKPAKRRPNLTIKTDVFVNKLRLNGLKAIGVECEINCQLQVIEARRENGDVAEIVRNHTHEQLAQIFRAIADGDEFRAETVTRNYLVAIATSSGTGSMPSLAAT